MEPAAITPACLSHVGNQEWAECTCSAPSGQHQTVDRSYVARTEVVCGERGHGSKTASVTHQNDERHDSQNRSRCDARKYPEENHLNHEDDGKCKSAGNGGRDPNPEDTPHSISAANNTDHARRNNDAELRQFLEEREFL